MTITGGARGMKLALSTAAHCAAALAALALWVEDVVLVLTVNMSYSEFWIFFADSFLHEIVGVTLVVNVAVMSCSSPSMSDIIGVMENVVSSTDSERTTMFVVGGISIELIPFFCPE